MDIFFYEFNSFKKNSLWLMDSGFFFKSLPFQLGTCTEQKYDVSVLIFVFN